MSDRLDLRGISVGTVLQTASARVVESQSLPPSRYTEGELLECMLNAAKFAKNKSDEQVLIATNGIGTARTRSESIVEMVRQGSLEREHILLDGRLIATVRLSEAGARLEAALPKELKDVGLTAKWEILLRRIEEGQLSPEAFREVARKFVRAIIRNVRLRLVKRNFATTDRGLEQNESVAKPL